MPAEGFTSSEALSISGKYRQIRYINYVPYSIENSSAPPLSYSFATMG